MLRKLNTSMWADGMQQGEFAVCGEYAYRSLWRDAFANSSAGTTGVVVGYSDMTAYTDG